MKSAIIVAALLGASLVSVMAQAPTLSGYDGNMQLFPRSLENVTGYYHLYWSVVYPDVQIGIVCERLPDMNMSWCGFGVSTTGGMVGSDGVIAFVDIHNNSDAHDYFLAGQYVPVSYPCYSKVCPDEVYSKASCENNVVWLNGYWVPDPTNSSLAYNVVEFTRPLNASDDCDNPIPANEPFKIVYSIGPETNVSGLVWPYNINHHMYRGPAPYPDAAAVMATFYEPGFTTGTTATTGAVSSTTTGTTGKHSTSTSTETEAAGLTLSTESAFVAAVVTVLALFALPYFV